MSFSFGALMFGVIGACAAVLTVDHAPRWVRVPTATNHRGRLVWLSLGVGVAAGYMVPTLVSLIGRLTHGDSAADRLWLLVAMILVFAAGRYDDVQSARVHGLGSHFRELGRGRMTSGIVKLIAALVASVIVALSLGLSGVTLAFAIPLVAGSTNLLNLLDVAPGRALKFAFCASVPLVVAEPIGPAWATLGVSAALLFWDVREYAMLGDEGSNLLGFVIGYVLIQALPGAWGLAVALVVVLVLHALAETVTLSRIIRATPPLRWIDDLWRIPAPDPSIG
jgi:UDP-GlcNAc:undecaprenyl-phosphate GlcNAc-1-phosphate transferase